MNLWIYWLIIIVILAIIEAYTVKMNAVWFIASGLISLIISFFNDNIILQFIIFIVFGIILLLSNRKKLVYKISK